jgi:hypothetical protein
VARVDSQRGEDGEDALLECLDQELLVLLVQVGPRRQPNAGLGRRRRHLVEEHRLHPWQQLVQAVADVQELLRGGPAVGAGGGHTRRHLVLQAGDPHLEELVEVLGEDGQELGPLQ